MLEKPHSTAHFSLNAENSSPIVPGLADRVTQLSTNPGRFFSPRPIISTLPGVHLRNAKLANPSECSVTFTHSANCLVPRILCSRRVVACAQSDGRRVSQHRPRPRSRDLAVPVGCFRHARCARRSGAGSDEMEVF